MVAASLTPCSVGAGGTVLDDASSLGCEIAEKRA